MLVMQELTHSICKIFVVVFKTAHGVHLYKVNVSPRLQSHLSTSKHSDYTATKGKVVAAQCSFQIP